MRNRQLFNKNQPACAYCRRGLSTATGEAVLCYYKGVCKPEDSCRRFQYDPLRRQPKQQPVLPDYDGAEFEL